jgi:L-fuculose-phosphate aldolase
LNMDALKAQICDVCHRMWQQGWVAANDGNVSVKLPDGTFLITPSGVSKSFITPEILLRVNAAMEVLEGPEGSVPSSELKMHMRCYEKRDDVCAVVHAHPPTATGYAVANIPLDEYSMIETVITIGAVPITPYGAPSTYEVPDAIEPYLQNHDALLLQNHGALTLGKDLLTAYYRMETLELFAKISFTAHMLGGAQEISRKNIDKLLDLRKNYYHVTGRHPGYEKCQPSQTPRDPVQEKEDE